MANILSPYSNAMKKFILILSIMAASNFSCQKCLHCVHTSKDANGVTHSIDLGERCGDQDEIKLLEDSCIKIAATEAGNCTCTRN